MDPILGRFLSTVDASPDRPLVLVGERRVTRADLCESARRTADGVRDWDLSEGAIVGMVAPPGYAFLNGYVALRMAGLCPLLIDASTPKVELARIADETGAAALWHPAEPCAGELDLGEMTLSSGPRIHLPDAALLKLTSGSTGTPVGIEVSAEALLCDSTAIMKSMGFRSGDRLLAAVPMSHAYGYSVLVLPPLIDDMTVVVPEDEYPLVAAKRHHATILPSVPSVYSALARQSSPPPWPETLRLLISAGAPLSSETAIAFRERFGAAIHVLYGASECGAITYDRLGTAAERGTVGTPLDGVEIELVERDEAEDKGVVRVHSGSVATGYVPASGGDADRLAGGAYRTDDVAEIVDGELVLHGRRGDWINVKGKKVNPREIEAALNGLPGVEDVAVVGYGSDTRGQGVRAIIACADGVLEYFDVTAWCRDRLAPHKIPRSVIFVRALPRTERGKLDRGALRALAPSRASSASTGKRR